jgi:hypothetical protein
MLTLRLLLKRIPTFTLTSMITILIYFLTLNGCGMVAYFEYHKKANSSSSRKNNFSSTITTLKVETIKADSLT